VLEGEQHFNVKGNNECEELSQDEVQKQPNGDCAELNHKRPLNVEEKNEQEEFFPDKVRKKLKTEQEIDDELVKLQELITNQFTEMRKMLHIGTQSQKRTLSKSTIAAISYDDDPEFMIKEEYSDDHPNEHPLAEIANKLKGVFTETQEALNRLLKTSAPVKIEETQPSEQSFQQISTENEEGEEIQIKMEASSPLEANSDYGNYFVEKTEMENKVIADEKQMEEEKLESKDDENENESQEMNSQILTIEAKSQLRLDFSEKDLSEIMFEDSTHGIEKNKISYLEVNFSASSLTDQQFTKFVQSIMTHMENLTSIMIDFAETRISSESLQVLSDQCLKKHKLKTFTLNCSGTSIGDQGIKSLDDGLGPSVQTLENVEIILNTTDIPGDNFLDALFGMDQLKRLKLSFEDSLITLEILSSVVFCLSFLAQNLESLELNFNGIEIYDESLGSFSNAVFHMEKLKHFKLCLGGTFISNDFLLDFFQTLSSLAIHLEALELDLHYTELNNRAFKHFCDGVLSEMKNVENLKLDLCGTKITDISLKNLILPTNKLKSLFLNLSENQIHDSGLKIFKENNNFKGIKSINLQVGQTDVTDQALQDFLEYVEKGYEVKALSPLKEASSGDPPDKEPNPKNGSKEFIPKELDPIVKVFAELKKELVLHYGLKSQPSKVETMRVSKLINNLEPNVYDKILVKILANILSIPKVEATELEEWKKIIQAKIISSLPSSKKLTSKKLNRRNAEAKQHNSAIVEVKQDSCNIETEQNNNNTQMEQIDPSINIETEQDPPKIETEQNDSNIKIELDLGDINVKTEQGYYINVDTEQNPPIIKTEQEDIDIKAEQNNSNVQTEQNHIDIPREQNIFSIERTQNNLVAERKREIFNIVSKYMGRKPKNIEKKQKIFDVQRIQSCPSNTEASQNHILSEIERKIWNVERNQNHTSAEKERKIFNIVRKYSGGRKQKNIEKKRHIFDIERVQSDSNIEAIQNNISSERGHDIFGIEGIQSSHMIQTEQNTFSIGRIQSSSNTEENPYYLNTGREQYLFNIERNQNVFNTEKEQNIFDIQGIQNWPSRTEVSQNSINNERGQNIFTIERTQNNFSIKRKPKIFTIIRNQKKISIGKKHNHINENHFSQNEAMRNLKISEEVFSFKWVRKYGKEILLREKIIEILKSMENRSLPVLYKKLLDYIQELSKTYPGWKMPDKIKSPIYASNWWSRFITGDPEIKSIWKSFSSSHDPMKQDSHQPVEIFYGF